MEQLSSELISTFGVFGFIIVGMGIALKYVVDEKNAEHEEIKEERKANLQVLSELKETLKAIEVMIKTII